MKTVSLSLPLEAAAVRELSAGDRVLLSGVLYTARDEAHKLLCRLLDRGEPLPFELRDACIYYTGPCPAPPGAVIGSCGPTTSGRMDLWTPRLLEAGLRGMVGKGFRSPAVREALVRYIGVYFAATGGAGALLAEHVRTAQVIAFPELGAEAIRQLEVCELPCTVINDCHGRDLYEEGRAKYRRSPEERTKA